MVDYSGKIWETLNRLYCDGESSMFVLSEGMVLNSMDYDVNNLKAPYNTYLLVNQAISCARNYTVTGSNVSTMWKSLLDSANGPSAGPSNKNAFERAKKLLYFDYSRNIKSQLYKDYDAKKRACLTVKQRLESELKKTYGDSWHEEFERRWPDQKEVLEYHEIQRRVDPLLQAISVWNSGTQYSVVQPIKDKFNRCGRIYTGDSTDGPWDYYHVSIQPNNWYKWFCEENEDDHEGWTPITVDFSDSPDGILTIDGKPVSTKESKDVKLTMEVRAAQIFRPWFDSSIFKFKSLSLPGYAVNSWSTGKIEGNDGSLPLVSTQIIVAKHIAFTSSDLNDEAKQAFAQSTDSSKFKLLNFSATSKRPNPQQGNDVILQGAQVIGFTCSVTPQFPLVSKS